jgi:hypothetical protein
MGQVRCSSFNKGDSKTPGHPDALHCFEKHHHKVWEPGAWIIILCPLTISLQGEHV